MRTIPTQISFCPFCGVELDPQSSVRNAPRECSKCSKLLPQIAAGFEYKSRLSLFGWPLVHIAMGSQQEGKRGVARGLIAIGDIAIGGLSFGGLAIGGVAFGGMALGLITLGGLSIGLILAIGGGAIGAGLSVGGCAIGSVAFGGLAVGYYAFGGGALGMHVVGGGTLDPIAQAMLQDWRGQLAKLLSQVTPLAAAAVVVPLLVLPFLRRTEPREEDYQPLGKPTFSTEKGASSEKGASIEKGASSGQPSLSTGSQPPANRPLDPFAERSSHPSLLGLLILLFVGAAGGLAGVWLLALLVLQF